MTAVWEDLVSAALLGTERRPYPDGDLADAAARLWAYREVGRRPPRLDPAGPGPAVPPPPPPDDRPLLPGGTLRSLASILAEPHLRPLLGEWLGLAQADGRRLPPEWLPPLLDLTADPDRPALDAAGGPRVAWLSAQRPEWAAGGAGPSARDLPEGDWADEPPAARAALVAGLADGLSMEDEPFLESALDDRRKEVRLAAASLLARLPASRFGERMAARATAAVQVRAGGRLAVRPPEEPDAPARRDGVTAGAAAPEQWLLQVVAAAPLCAWPGPDALVAAAASGSSPPGPGTVKAGSTCEAETGDSAGSPSQMSADFTGPAAALVAAWSLAVERQGDAGWARRLLAAGAPPTAGVLSVLPPPEAEQALLAWLARVPFRAAAGLLGELPGPWTAAVTDTVMARLARLVASEDPADRAPAVRDALPRFALAAAPSCATAVAAAAGALEAVPADRRPAARLFWGRALTSLNALVHFRQAMHQEFSDR